MSKYNLSNTPTIWDAKQLIKSYVNLFYFREDLCKDSDFVKVPHSDQVRMKRLYSAICAFNGLKFDEGKVLSTIDETFDGFEFEFNHEDQSEEYLTLVKNKVNEISASVNFNSYSLDEESDNLCGEIFESLMEFRLRLEALKETYSGVYCASMNFVYGSNLVESIFFKDLEQKSEILDEMLALLLGEQFQNKSFTEEELKANWHFPTETDSDLLDWDVDNF